MRMKFLGLMLALMATAGCASKLETGYVPRPLGAATPLRRGYYAQPFTPQAAAAQQYQDSFEDHKARPAY